MHMFYKCFLVILKGGCGVTSGVAAEQEIKNVCDKFPAMFSFQFLDPVEMLNITSMYVKMDASGIRQHGVKTPKISISNTKHSCCLV